MAGTPGAARPSWNYCKHRAQAIVTLGRDAVRPVSLPFKKDQVAGE
jgi:hypothetical protein